MEEKMNKEQVIEATIRVLSDISVPVRLKEQITVPMCPTWSRNGSSQRGGRPVTNTTSMPAASADWNAATVRWLIFPLWPRMVPSMSLAIKCMTSGYRCPGTFSAALDRAGGRGVSSGPLAAIASKCP